MVTGLNEIAEDWPAAGQIGSERINFNSFLAIKDFIPPQYFDKINVDRESHRIELMQQIKDEVELWNEETHNFNMLWEQNHHRIKTFEEADIGDNL